MLSLISLRSLAFFLLVLLSCSYLIASESDNYSTNIELSKSDHIRYNHQPELNNRRKNPNPSSAQPLAQATKTYQFDLAVCAIFQNEAPYLKEWIEFHKLVGVQHFYLFNNLSTDDYLSVLEPYIFNKEVELIQWPYQTGSRGSWDNIQCSSYNEALKRALYKVKWLALIDIDEYIVPMVADNLINILRDYEEFGGLGINWQMFGTSHVAQIPKDRTMTETLRLKAPETYGENCQIKSIVRPEFVSSCRVHYCFFKPGYFNVSENKEPFHGHISPYISVNKIRINHYWSKDEEFFYKVKVPRREKWNFEDFNGMVCRVNNCNVVEDDSLLRFIPELRQRMGLD